MTWGKVLQTVGTYAVVGGFAIVAGANWLEIFWNYVW